MNPPNTHPYDRSTRGRCSRWLVESLKESVSKTSGTTTDKPNRDVNAMRLPLHMGWLVWVLMPIFLTAVVSLWLVDLPGVRRLPIIATALDFAFPMIICGFAAGLLAKSFLISGAPGLPVLGCGVILWGLAGMAAMAAAPDDVHLGATVYYNLAWLSSLCHLIGAFLSLRTRQPVSSRILWLSAAYALVVVVVALAMLLARAGGMPHFFAPDRDIIPLREPTLISAIAMFVLAALLLGAGVARHGPVSTFVYWYTLALGLIAVGILGVVFQSSLGAASWTSRSSQFLGGLYMLLIAAIASQRESRIKALSTETALRQTEDLYRLLFTNMNEGFFIAEILCDKDGVPRDYRHINVNPAYEESSGLTREQLLGKTATEAFHPSPSPLVMEKFCEAGLLGKSSHFEIYSQALGKHLDVHAFPCGTGRFGVISVDISERKQMELALRDLNVTLESKVIQRTAELKRRTEQLQRLAVQLSLAEERERKRIGAFLHEDLQQQIAGAKFHLNLLSKQAKHDPEQKDLIAKVDEILREAIEKSRSLSHELSPDVLSRNDLAETLRWLADQMYARQGLRVRVDARSEATLQSDAITIFLFRAVQEMLSNVIQHAGVRDAAIRMSRHGRYVRVSVSDRGKGFDPQVPKEASGFGLLNIRERAELLGGRMKIRSRPGEGSTLSITVPDEVARTCAGSASDVKASHSPAT